MPTDLYPAGNYNLFNGNISAMVSSIWLKNASNTWETSPQFALYSYDQLNRIKSIRTNNQLDDNTNAWPSSVMTSSNRYHANYTYDGNGNIATLQRRDADGVMFDNFTYHYAGGTNRLNYVDDQGTDIPAYSDLKTGQSANNYVYDEIGNLVLDRQEDLHIEWNAYGKIARIMKCTTEVFMEFAYDAMGNRVMKKVNNLSGCSTSTSEYSFYTRDAQGNVMAVYEYSSTTTTDLLLAEQPLYGSSRLGMRRPATDVSDPELPACTACTYTYTLGKKVFELSNHLGNVLTTLSDRRISETSGGTLVAYHAQILSSQDYYPFGSVMPGRSFSSEAYRWGFNTQERDDEIYGTGNSYAALYWQYDARIGRRWNLDPVNQVWASDYSCFANNPIYIIDHKGDRPIRNRSSQSVTANIRLRDVTGGMSDEERAHYGNLIRSNIQEVFGAAGITADLTVEWTDKRGGILGTGIMAGWFSSNVYFDVERGGTRSSAHKGGNKGRFNLNGLDVNPNVAAHEFAHLLGLSDRYHYWADYDANNRQLSAFGAAPMTKTQVGNDPDHVDDNLMSGGSILTSYQKDIIFKYGPRIRRGEKNYAQVLVFYNIPRSGLGLANIDYVKRTIYLNSNKVLCVPYIYTSSVPFEGKGKVRGNSYGENMYKIPAMEGIPIHQQVNDVVHR